MYGCTDCIIGAEGGKALTGALNYNSVLTTLILGCMNHLIFFIVMDLDSYFHYIYAANKICDEGAKVLGEALKSNTALTALGLRSMKQFLFYCFLIYSH